MPRSFEAVTVQSAADEETALALRAGAPQKEIQARRRQIRAEGRPEEEMEALFLEEQDLIDLPEHETLYTALSPSHFAGAAVGGVYSAGPFDPEAETLFYLPSVPDSAPVEVRDGFYRSFNTHFNTMIITHEIYPGHYLQLKVAASHPSRIRALFAGNDFTEGWASFCEQMTLDAGFEGDPPLTRMAHLRKRLENAVRAYVSVQVHCRGWSRNQLHTFAVETGLSSDPPMNWRVSALDRLTGVAREIS